MGSELLGGCSLRYKGFYSSVYQPLWGCCIPGRWRCALLLAVRVNCKHWDSRVPYNLSLQLHGKTGEKRNLWQNNLCFRLWIQNKNWQKIVALFRPSILAGSLLCKDRAVTSLWIADYQLGNNNTWNSSGVQNQQKCVLCHIPWENCQIWTALRCREGRKSERGDERLAPIPV